MNKLSRAFAVVFVLGCSCLLASANDTHKASRAPKAPVKHREATKKWGNKRITLALKNGQKLKGCYTAEPETDYEYYPIKLPEPEALVQSGTIEESHSPFFQIKEDNPLFERFLRRFFVIKTTPEITQICLNECNYLDHPGLCAEKDGRDPEECAQESKANEIKYKGSRDVFKASVPFIFVKESGKVRLLHRCELKQIVTIMGDGVD